MQQPDPSRPRSTAPSWSLGAWFGSRAWFGSQGDSTLWMVLLGFVTAARNDLQTAVIALDGAALLNLGGLILWRQSRMCSIFATLQFFLAATTLVTAGIVFSLNRNGELPTAHFLPYWVIAVPAALMLMVLLFERQTPRPS